MSQLRSLELASRWLVALIEALPKVSEELNCVIRRT